MSRVSQAGDVAQLVESLLTRHRVLGQSSPPQTRLLVTLVISSQLVLRRTGGCPPLNELPSQPGLHDTLSQKAKTKLNKKENSYLLFYTTELLSIKKFW